MCVAWMSSILNILGRIVLIGIGDSIFDTRHVSPILRHIFCCRGWRYILMAYWRCIDCYNILGLNYETSHPYIHTHIYMFNGMAWNDWSLLNTINHHMMLNVTLLCTTLPWWRYQMETFSALLAHCVGNLPLTGEIPAQRPVTRSFGVFFDLCLNKRLSKPSWGWWLMTPSRSLWRHGNDKE